MTDITKNEKQLIGGFGFQALQHWYGRHVCDVFEQDTPVWNFLRGDAKCLSQGGDCVTYTPCLANISLIYCLENKIDSIHLSPRQSNMTNTVALYIQYLLNKTEENTLIYYLAQRDDFSSLSNRVLGTSEEDSPAYMYMHKACMRYFGGSKTPDVNNPIQWSINEDHMYFIKTASRPVYIFVNDALFYTDWEQYLHWLRMMQENNGADITIACISTLNKRTDSIIRSDVYRRLHMHSDTVYYNDEIFYKPITYDMIGVDSPAIVYTDFRHIHKDKSDEFIQRMEAVLRDRDSSMLAQEVYLEYPMAPTEFIRR